MGLDETDGDTMQFALEIWEESMEEFVFACDWNVCISTALRPSFSASFRCVHRTFPSVDNLLFVDI